MGDEEIEQASNEIEFHRWKFRLALMSPKRLTALNNKAIYRMVLKENSLINTYSSARAYVGVRAAYLNSLGWDMSALLDETCSLMVRIGKVSALRAGGSVTSTAYPWLQIQRFTEPDWSDGLIWSFYGYFQNHEQFSHPFPRRRGREKGLTAPEVMDLAFELLSSDHPNLTRSGCLLYTSPSPRDATLSRMPSSA